MKSRIVNCCCLLFQHQCSAFLTVSPRVLISQEGLVASKNLIQEFRGVFCKFRWRDLHHDKSRFFKVSSIKMFARDRESKEDDKTG